MGDISKSNLMLWWHRFKISMAVKNSCLDRVHIPNMSSIKRRYSGHFSPKSGYIWSFSNFPINMFAYGGAHIVPIAHPRICKYCSSLNSKLFRVSTSVNRFSIACMKLKECVFDRLCPTAFLPSLCGMFVYSDHTSIVNRNEPSGTMKSSILVMKSVVFFT